MAAAAAPGAAQGTFTVDLAPLDLTDFPRVETFLHVLDSSGAFVSGLAPGSVTVIEDNQRLSAVEFEELQPGAIFVVAINPGHFFGIRDGAGTSHYDLIHEALAAWGRASGGEKDDLSLIINDGPVSMHLSSRSDWLSTLESFDRETRSAEASVDILSQAINAASIEAPRPGMGRSVLLITAPPRDDLSKGLTNLVSISRQAGVHVSVWLVDSADMQNSPASRQLQELAAQTGGQFFYYSGSEALPDPENCIATLQGVYRLAYQSQISSPGNHSIAVEVAVPGGNLAVSSPLSVTLDLQPPDPAFVTPPLSVVRQNPEDARNVSTDLQPISQDLLIAVQFPDGKPRDLLSTSLYVDGVLAAINQQAPFDRFHWDISPYLESGQHMLRVDAVDIQGMTGSTGDLLVNVEVRRTQPSLWKTILRNVPWFAGGAVLLSGSVLVLVLLVSGRIKPRVALRGELAAPGARLNTHKNDPVTQPVKVRQEPTLKRETGPRQKQKLLSRLAWPHRRVVIESIAFLNRLSEGEMDASAPLIPISRGTTVIGIDPVRGDLVLDDPSVESLHARLQRDGDVLRLSDLGSVAGTWVNYTPVSAEGTVLEHGDIIHIGRVGFRVSLKNPAPQRKPVVTPEEPSK
jgi:hypothetical protein